MFVRVADIGEMTTDGYRELDFRVTSPTHESSTLG
jgi:hypothetical protein